jgi:hypothetical protein
MLLLVDKGSIGREGKKFYARQVDGNMHAACITNKRDVSV